ncbi:MAG: RnfABCDGE type electron transport complex subunit D, partial [Candidatus Hadarchaeales archaeon]
LIGGLLLIALKYIDWKTPVSYIGTVGLLMFLLGQDPLFHILAGGLFLGAFFMATDYVTTPLTGKGRVIFGFGAGLLVVVIRMYGGMPEGVTYSILIMNAFTPLIDRYTKPRVYGTVRKRWWERKK